MTQPDIEQWVKRIKSRGLLKDRGDGDKDWVSIGAPDGSILETRQENVYFRVVWSERNSPETPFAFWRFEAEKNTTDEEHESEKRFPKNLFIGTNEEPKYLTTAQVEEKLFTLI